MADEFDNAAGPQFRVTEAVREAVPALIGLWGYSDSGKTYSALRLARGLAGPKGKIVVIDTENKRAKLYAGLFGGWSHIDLQPPFTPDRYMAAHRAALEAGAKAVVIDSMSHVWQGEGGVLDQADRSNLKGLAKWKTPKIAYTRMTNALFRAPVHVVFCVRAKEKFVQRGSGKEAEIISAGDVPICDARFMYEMTVAVHMAGGEHKPIAPVKAPEAIKDVIRPGEFIDEEAGRKIAEWLAGGAPVDHEVLALQASARGVAAEGSVAMRDYWASLAKPQQKALASIVPELQELAKHADEEIAQGVERIHAANEGDPLDDAFTGTPRQAAE